MFEVWGEGCSLEEMRSSVERYPEERKSPYLCEDSTFKITVDCFGRALSTQEQTDRINGCSYIPFKVHWLFVCLFVFVSLHDFMDVRMLSTGPELLNGEVCVVCDAERKANLQLVVFQQGQVRLKNPQHKFRLIETDSQSQGTGLGTPNGLPPSTTKVFYFGREIGGADRSLVPKYELRGRKYLGPTAMDAEMAMLMANQALVEPGKLVYDPFVGTGSILVAAAHYGAITMASVLTSSPLCVCCLLP